ncbi:hypothetical protein [Roseomonas xinghualingensis]|uniref:hypothetical protein n=1 Tax=Roseomonas xinghualingensis TaxID=2986475 RepID=UPI0021F10136|nr:hypothetical protein [Roseomonas sp. SXEYE001]MCV4207160.1 hypothetical protein [Roseomonas sp. SXEYE001]
MTPHNAASRAAEAIAYLLSGPIDECSRALAAGDVPNAKQHLNDTAEMLRRIRRNLREETGLADPKQEGLAG